MAWFNFWQRKESASSRVIMQSVTAGQAKSTPRDYKELAKQGYQEAVWVYACINEITRSISSVPLLLYRQNKNKLEEVTQHPLLELINEPIRDPLEGVSYPEFIEAAIAYKLLSGNTYIEVVKAGSKPQELHLLRPDRMRIIPGENSILGFEYKVNSNKVNYSPEDVIHHKSFHPLNDWYGMSTIEAAAKGIDSFNYGSLHNLALLQNGASPSGAWVTENELTDIQFNRMKHQMTDYEGAKNAGKQLLLEGGLNWKQFGLSQKDIDWLQGLDNAAVQIHAAFGVHPVLTGAQNGTFENQKQAYRALLTRVSLPLLESFLRDFMRFMRPYYNDKNLKLWYDRDQIPALSEDQDSLWKRVTEAYDKGILIKNEARVALGYEEDAGQDTYKQMKEQLSQLEDSLKGLLKT